MKNGIPAALRSLFSSTTALTELIPLLMRIISPPLRPVSQGEARMVDRG
jgi:chromosome transmission fidelity protein 18